MKQITLTRGMVALVDDSDFELVSSYKWCANKIGKTYYAVAHVPNSGHNGKTIYMHKLLMPNGAVDHIDNNGLNNTRSNLRYANKSTNSQNASRKNNTSGYIGVTWDKWTRKWASGIMVNHKNIRLGRFTDIKDAARAYNQAALKYFGEHAQINHID